MITDWAKIFFLFPLLIINDSLSVLSFNPKIKIDNKGIFISGLVSKNINFISQIFHYNNKIKSWDHIKSDYNLESKLKYCSIQLTDTLPKLLKDRIFNCRENSMNLCIFDHCLIKKKQQLILLEQIGK